MNAKLDKLTLAEIHDLPAEDLVRYVNLRLPEHAKIDPTQIPIGLYEAEDWVKTYSAGKIHLQMESDWERYWKFVMKLSGVTAHTVAPVLYAREDIMDWKDAACVGHATTQHKLAAMATTFYHQALAQSD